MVSHAMLPNALWRLFFPVGGETVESSTDDGPNTQPQGAPEASIVEKYQSVVHEYLSDGVTTGAFITEAADFSACAAWWPPGSHHAPGPTTTEQALEESSQTDTESILAQFDRLVTPLYRTRIWAPHGQAHWKLGLLARDPRKASVPGAVRALLQPVIERARADGTPIWLVTSSEHAREIYLHYGWVEAGVVEVQGWRQWCLVLETGDKTA